MNYDENGLICFKRPDGYLDGGDSAQRAGFYCSGLFLSGSPNEGVKAYLDMADKLIVNGKLVRNPRPGDSSPKWNNPRDCSRDQYRPMIIAAGLYGLPEVVDVLTSNIKAWTFPNYDVCLPNYYNEITRARYGNSRPVTGLGEACNRFDVRIRLSKSAKDPDDVGDDLNLLLSLAQGVYVNPNETSIANAKEYLSKRPTNYGCTKLGHKDPVIGALAWYFRADERGDGNPEIAGAWCPAIKMLREKLGVQL